MRFEWTVALKYLIPKWHQLSVSMISLISTLVISLVVWLVVLFLSVTEGMERKWKEELVALNAPLRMTPTEAYYNSYYYQIDSLSSDSDYLLKTLSEKKSSLLTDPYDPACDREVPRDFPLPDCHSDGSLRDIVKESFQVIEQLPYCGIEPREAEVGFGNLRLQLLRKNTLATTEQDEETFLTQVSYVVSHDHRGRRLDQMLLPMTPADYSNFLEMLERTLTCSPSLDLSSDTPLMAEPLSGSSLSSFRDILKRCFAHLHISALSTATEKGFLCDRSLFPAEGHLKAVALLKEGKIARMIIPSLENETAHVAAYWEKAGFDTAIADLLLSSSHSHASEVHLAALSPHQKREEEPQEIRNLSIDGLLASLDDFPLFLDKGITFKAKLLEESLERAHSLKEVEFAIEGSVQGLCLTGTVRYEQLEIAEIASPQSAPTASISSPPLPPLWVHRLPEGGCSLPSDEKLSSQLGHGLLVSKHYQKNGVRLGDRGYLAHYAEAGSTTQELRIPVYVAGFYDPGMMPVGNKLIFAQPELTALLHTPLMPIDPLLGNSINIWLDRLEDAPACKEALVSALRAQGLAPYWHVQSYQDYEFSKPILEQLQSDKNLFTIITIIILIVACSNIISMLILLVNNKKREIGILQSLGASPKRIALIFGLCGFLTGAISCFIGILAAVLTLNRLQSLVDFLSLLQGREVFQTAFYGSSLPNELSYSALLFVTIATLMISLLAGLIPAIKAARMRPTEILRSE